MKDDEIITEVRRNREQLFKECGGTLEGLVAHLKEWERKHPERMVSLPPRRIRKASPKAV